jgi:hypothetical protein
LLPSGEESELTPRIRLAPEYNWSALVLWGTEDIMELDGKSVQVPNVQWSEIVVECVV